MGVSLLKVIDVIFILERIKRERWDGLRVFIIVII